MKGMDKIKRGTGFRGLLNYLLEHSGEGHDEPGRLIGGNMSGITARQLAAEFAAFRQLRADIEKPVWHNSLRLPPGDFLADEQWRAVVADYMEAMGFDPDHPYTVVAHDDEGAVHIAACRVSASGKVYLGRNENLKSTRIIQQLEKKHGLRITPGPQYEQDEDGDFHIVGGTSDVAKLSKNEIDKAVRTGEEPPKQKLQRIIDEAKTGRPTAVQFAEKLAAAGVTAVANIASTGRLNGFSFEVDGIPFKGSQLGKAYAWGQLSKEVSYEQDRDSQTLRQYYSAARNGADSQSITEDDRGNAAERPDAANARQSRSEDRAAGASTGRFDDRRAVGHEVSRTVSDQRSTTAGEGSSITVEAVERPTVSSKERPTVIGESDSTVVNSDKLTDVHGAYARVLDLGGLTVGNAAHAAKLKAWQQQHNALLAPEYRITLTSRRENLKTYNMGKGKNGESERFYSAEDVAGLIPTLSRQNARGYDIYVTPIDPAHHYLVVDDMTEKTYSQLLKSGYSPTLVQSSSEGNRQAVIKVERDVSVPQNLEQSAANKLVQYLNRELGDPKFSGVVHPFRVAGFSNKKPGKRDFFTRLLKSGHALCAKATQALKDFRDDAMGKVRDAMAQTQKKHDSHTEKHDYSHVEGGSDAASQAYAKVLRQVKVAGWTLDASAVDFRVAQDLLKQGYDTQQVESLLLTHSPDLGARHKDAFGYVSRTVSSAYNSLDVIAQSAEQSESASDDWKTRTGERSMYTRPRW